jgi:hypothetical protein
MKKIIAQFVPMILIFLFLSKSNEFFQFSKTILGKIIAILLIIFYVSVDKFVGLFVCALVVLFYQSDNIEGMETIDQNEVEAVQSENDVDDGTYTYIEDSSKTSASPVEVIEKKMLTLGLTDSGPIFRGNEDDFRKQNCEKGVLKHKNLNVKHEMAEHIFPEMKFREGICNPCDKTCEISIIEGKLKTENEIKPSFTRP